MNEKTYFVVIGRGNVPRAYTASSPLEAVAKALVYVGVRVEEPVHHENGDISMKKIDI